MKTKKSKILALVISIVLFGIIISGCYGPGAGCTGPGARGWSGFSGDNKTIYVGTMAGEVLALNPSARAKGLSFPSDGEWEYVIKMPSSGGSMCGPMLACGPGSTPVGVTIYGTPVVSSDLVYVGTYNGKVYALNSVTGALRWVYPREGNETIGAIVGDLVLHDGTIYLGSSNGKVYALDAETGDHKWEFLTGDRIWTSPAISDDIVYVSSYDRKLYFVSSKDGSELRHPLELPAVMCSSPVVFGDSIYFGTFDRNLYAVNKNDANIRWKFEGGNWFWSAPLVEGKTIYAGCLDSKIYAIDAETGMQLWQFDADDAIVSDPVFVDELIAVVSESGSMYLLNKSTGGQERTISIGYDVMAPLYAIGNIVYVHGRDDYVYGVDIDSGQITWKFKKVSK